jgi:hypothetical protein
MKLEKVEEDESKMILQQWVKTMIEERQKFEVKHNNQPNISRVALSPVTYPVILTIRGSVFWG